MPTNDMSTYNDPTCDGCGQVDGITLCANQHCVTERHRKQLCATCSIQVSAMPSPLCRTCFEHIPRQTNHALTVSIASLQANYRTHIPHDPRNAQHLVQTLHLRIKELETRIHNQNLQIYYMREQERQQERQERKQERA